jgi:hypothetical protein
MKAYLIYHRDSGKIIHRHLSSGAIDLQNAKSRRHLLDLVHPSHAREPLEVLPIEDEAMRPGATYQVDPQNKQLIIMPGAASAISKASPGK